jgi:hypothetical protein
MDVKVYQKEEVKQPEGSEYIYVPNVIDIIPVIDDSSGSEIITGAVELLDDDKELLEQQCALATIFQKGLDPLDLADGIRWSEAILGEISAVQLMDDITNAVAEVSTTVTVVFDTVTDSDGRSYLTYTLKEIA